MFNLSAKIVQFTHFSSGKIWFEGFAPCKRCDISQLCPSILICVRGRDTSSCKNFCHPGTCGSSYYFLSCPTKTPSLGGPCHSLTHWQSHWLIPYIQNTVAVLQWIQTISEAPNFHHIPSIFTNISIRILSKYSFSKFSKSKSLF